MEPFNFCFWAECSQAMALNRCNPKILWGDVLELTPSYSKAQGGHADGLILAWNKPSGGDIASLGQKGTNNYNDFWHAKKYT